MDVVYERSEVSAAEVREALPDPPSYSAVRATLRLLVDKGHLRHRKVGRKYLFRPTVGPARARRSALERVLRTFFDGSVEQAVASLLDMQSRQLSGDELDRLAELIEKARKDGRKR